MKVATYNFCKGGPDFDATFTILNHLKADVVLAQELLNPQVYLEKGKLTWRNLKFQDPVWQHAPTERTEESSRPVPRWGSAILVREGSLTPINVPSPLGGWVVGATLTSPLLEATLGSPLKLFSVHTPTLRASNYYPWQAQEVCEYLGSEIRGGDTLVGGDFNVTISAPTSDQRSENDPPAQIIRDYIRRTLNLLNCWQLANPNKALPPTLRSGSHLDAIFVSANLSRYLATCRVHDEQDGAEWPFGDHHPVVAEFDADMPKFKSRNWPASSVFARSDQASDASLSDVNAI